MNVNNQYNPNLLFFSRNNKQKVTQVASENSTEKPVQNLQEEKSSSSDLTLFVNNYVNMYKNEKISDTDTEVAPSLQQLKNMGLSEEDIEKYFDKVTNNTDDGKILEAYILKENIIINGIKIDSVDKLLEALDVDTEPYRMANNLQELKNWGLTDEEIAEYFDYVESNSQDDVVLSGYCIKKGVIINDKKIKSFEDLKEALALVDTTKMALPAIYLKKYGFTQTEIDKYFNKYPTTDYKGNPTFNYGLKRGIIINGQGVNSFNELIEILNKKDAFNFFRK